MEPSFSPVTIVERRWSLCIAYHMRIFIDLSSCEFDMRKDLVKNLLENAQQSGNLIKGSKDGIILATELVNIFVKEAILRSRSVAKGEGEDVGTTHLEAILPQLLLDF
eukprot:jgi/Bigna1/145221/aug1.96_g19929